MFNISIPDWINISFVVLSIVGFYLFFYAGLGKTKIIFPAGNESAYKVIEVEKAVVVMFGVAKGRFYGVDKLHVGNDKGRRYISGYDQDGNKVLEVKDNRYQVSGKQGIRRVFVKRLVDTKAAVDEIRVYWLPLWIFLIFWFMVALSALQVLPRILFGTYL